ncbi:long-chain-fatty-acid CoA ligase [Striga asiatica]|uniref:Long-chain-fatty-acid--CoA ligase n=1 Tax=Striga asiatica TaxID=4170 RepID=A0A5A7QXU7_STRAF|nr:long-chain-fatty-acid CoA ligase [Striga asiatica]
MGDYIVKVEEGRAAADGKPSSGPVYRCIYAKDGLLEIPDELESPSDFFSDNFIYDGQANAYMWQTYKQVYDDALKIGSAIRGRGLNPGDKCGIYGANCPEWIMAMQACNSHAITYVPLYDTLGPNAVEFIINHAEVSLAFVQECKLPSILTCLPKCTSFLKTIVSFGKISDQQKTAANEVGVDCFSWEEFSLLGNMDCNLPPKNKTMTCTIMYTSGTTGEPKGVVLTNGAFMAQVLSIDLLLRESNDEAKEDDVYFSFLPLAHIFDQVIETYMIYRGSSIGYWQGDVKFLMEDLLVLRPTVFCGVPRVFERIYAGIMDKISAGGLLKKSLFQLAYYYKLRNLQKGVKQDEASPLFDKLVFDKIKQGFGGRVRLIFSGAAPLPKHIEEFLRVACCCMFSQGYGNVHSMVGAVGIPMPTVEARLESIPEMGYDALSSVPRGEICIRGNILFSGYYKRLDLTQQQVVDGWFHTGDVGEWQPDGVMKIIDRKKNIFKLSQGEYVAVESIESVYSQCPLVTSVWVYGDSFESFLVAVVVPEIKALEDWAANNQEKGDFQSLCGNSKAKKYILDELNNTAKKHGLRGFEMLRGVHLEPLPFDISRDLITPTFKLKRPQLYKYYKDHIDQLYAEAKGTKQ